MRPFLAVLATALLSVACSGDLIIPGPSLTGQWGGAGMEFTATDAKMVVRTDCDTYEFAGPTVLQSDGSFAAEGIATLGWAAHTYPQHGARIHGKMVGATVELTLEAQDYYGHWGLQGHWEKPNGIEVVTTIFRLTGGAHISFPVGVGCLA